MNSEIFLKAKTEGELVVAGNKDHHIHSKEDLSKYLMDNEFENLPDGKTVSGMVVFDRFKNVTFDGGMATWKTIDEMRFVNTS